MEQLVKHGVDCGVNGVNDYSSVTLCFTLNEYLLVWDECFDNLSRSKFGPHRNHERLS